MVEVASKVGPKGAKWVPRGSQRAPGCTPVESKVCPKVAKQMPRGTKEHPGSARCRNLCANAVETDTLGYASGLDIAKTERHA